MKKRLITIAVTAAFVFSCAIGRIAWIMFSGNYTVSSTYNSYTLTIDKLYPTVYDCNINKITNNELGYAAIIRPNEKCLSELELLFNKEEISQITSELSKGYPVIRKIKNNADCKYIQIEEILTDDSTEKSILIKNVQQHFNEVIAEKTVNFTVDAKGRLLDGDAGTVNTGNYTSRAGIALTIDRDIQKCVEDAAVNMNKGAVVVMDIRNGNILASYSTPNDIIDRCFSPYCVGSVFKLIVAASALENNISLSYTCEGETTVGDTTFSCQKNKAHGKQDMKAALANSCNCYFIELALKLGADRISKTAADFGFGDTTELYDDWKISNGNLPSDNELQSKGQLSLLGFGQGSLTSTPLQFAAAVCAIANGGVYKSPNLILGAVDDNGKLEKYNNSNERYVISTETSEILKQYMRYVVTDGTAYRADYKNNSAGKTSTAQSGRYVNGKEILNTWFAGFYPYDNPQYAIVVMTEDGTSGAGDCCPVFRTIVENMDE